VTWGGAGCGEGRVLCPQGSDSPCCPTLSSEDTDEPVAGRGHFQSCGFCRQRVATISLSLANCILRPYFEAQGHLSMLEEVLAYDDSIVITQVDRLEVLREVHAGNLGITKCRDLARSLSWWPGMSQLIA